MSADERVILVHGTYSSAKSDEGARWWQRDSQFVRDLTTRLPHGIRLLDQGDFFAWSGANSYAERRYAAIELYKFLQKFESDDIPYHIVAHSHGGSIVWDTLTLFNTKIESEVLLADIFRKKQIMADRFTQLRSVTTIGTPFVHWAPKSELLGRLGKTVPFGVFFIGILFVSVIFLLALGSSVITGYERIETGIFVSFVILLSLAILSTLVGFLDTTTTMASEREHARRAVLKHGAKWLGIHSAYDEALNGLRASQFIRHPILARNDKTTTRSFPAFNIANMDSSLSLRFDRLVWWPFKKVMSILMPLLDRLVWSQLEAIALGGDRLGSKAGSVSSSPIADLPEMPSLNDAVSRRLLKKADTWLSQATPELRSLLVAWWSTAVVEVNKDVLSQLGDKALVHTQYYDDSEIVDLIVLHISESSQNSMIQSNFDATDSAWYREYRKQLEDALNELQVMYNNGQLLGQKLSKQEWLYLLTAALLGAPLVWFLWNYATDVL